ncbi:dephospho-CoA kinase [Couchioplanes azureus]|uniref:dephospho-CoA kinase n=1 Tax=Couchioplanes caeruleus TaxID=56438 RepID=UPI001670B3E0|nr:dephospho-CoA kinase [Couchioplanes caeruleus]GGQ51379.1 dephospho-CoA kinase [Couchioplanes caeruleus subsp. azureus]
MLKVGLTGGIGAGKSAVAQRLQELGAVILDADKIARDVVAAGTDGHAAVVAAFGSEVVGADGELDRPALGARVFGDESARRRLESIIHPRVRARTAELAAAAPADAIVVNDVPLLVETGLAPTFHLVIVVDAAAEVRIARLVGARGMTAEHAAARIAAQADDADRRAAADVVIDNNGGLDELTAQVDELWRARLRPYGKNLRLRRHAPVDATAPVVASDPAWPGQAARLIARINHALRPQLGRDADISHIGSTSVPGLPAKDLIDLMLAVPTLELADKLADALAGAGLPPRNGEWFDNARGIPGKTWPKRLHGSADPGRSVNLHVRVAGSPGWRFALLMRDHLRAVPQARDEYAAAKAHWAEIHGDPEGYAAAKEPWFDAEATAAHEWAEATGWQPPLRS